MSETAPANPLQLTAKRPRRPVVRVSTDGTNPTEANEADFLQAMEIRHVSGSSLMDTCELFWDIGKTGRRVVDLTSPIGWNFRVEVWLPNQDGEVEDVDGKLVGTLLHWGEVSIQQMTIRGGNNGTEGMALTSRVEPRHFGKILLGQVVCDPTFTLRQQDTEVVFNPLYNYDNKVRGNMSSRREPVEPELGKNWYNVFVDPSSADSGPAVTSNRGQTASLWKMADAVKYLCYTLNGEEKCIDNPTVRQIEDALGDIAAATTANPGEVIHRSPELRNFKVKRGEYLPKVLDQLLQPHGFDWCLVPTTKKDSTNRLQIKLYKFGEGDQKDVYLQKPGEELDLAKSNVLNYDGSINVADLANKVICQGDFIEREVTVELYRAWPEADDGMNEVELSKKTLTDQSKRFVWRKWVLNEAGDYTGLRHTTFPIPTWFSVSSFLGDASVIKRRKFHDCLAYDPDKKRRDPVIEFLNPTPDEGAVPKWERVTDSCHLLEHECGVMFDEDQPPTKLVSLGNDARIRVTGTIRGDTRVTGTAELSPNSPNANEVILYLDVHDIFSDRLVQKVGDYASSLAANSAGSDEKDDTVPIQKYAEAVRKQEDAARLTASFVLHGLHPDYEIGQIVTKIDGRNISFNRYNPAQDAKKFLQIVAVTHDPQAQTTTLQVDSLELKKKDMDTGFAY